MVYLTGLHWVTYVNGNGKDQRDKATWYLQDDMVQKTTKKKQATSTKFYPNYLFCMLTEECKKEFRWLRRRCFLSFLYGVGFVFSSTDVATRLAGSGSATLSVKQQRCFSEKAEAMKLVFRHLYRFIASFL